MTNVEELKGLLERATKGPWRYDDGKILTPSNERLRVSGTSQPSGYVPDEDESYANAQLIVAAVNALPALLEEREHLQRTIRDYIREFDSPVSDPLLRRSLREQLRAWELKVRGERTP